MRTTMIRKKNIENKQNCETCRYRQIGCVSRFKIGCIAYKYESSWGCENLEKLVLDRGRNSKVEDKLNKDGKK